MRLRARGALLAASALGALFTLLVVVPRVWPVETYAAWCRFAYGGAPSARGLVLTLAPAPPGTGGAEGAWVALELRNVEDAPTLVHLLDPPGAEWGFVVTDAAGERLPPLEGLEAAQSVRPLRVVPIPAQGRVSLVLDLARHVSLRPGRLRVVARKVDLKDGHGMVSEPVWIEVPAP